MKENIYIGAVVLHLLLAVMTAAACLTLALVRREGALAWYAALLLASVAAVIYVVNWREERRIRRNRERRAMGVGREQHG